MGLSMVSTMGAAALVVIFLGAAPAAAATEAGGIPLGPLLGFPALLVSLTHDDNVYLAADGEQEDWFTTVAPTLRLEFPVQRLRFEVEGGVEARTYDRLEAENATDWFVGAAAGADFPGGLDFRLSGRHDEEYLTTSQEFGAGETSTLNTLAATVGYRVRDALRLEAGARSVEYDYERSLDRERVETSLRGDVFWRFQPRTSAFLEGTVTNFDYDSNVAVDNRETAVALGLTWEATSRSTALVKAGYEWKRYDATNPAIGAEDGEYFVLAAGGRHEFTRRTALELGLSRGTYESDFAGNPYYLQTAFSAGLTQRFTTKVGGRASVRYTLDGYPNAVTYDNPYDPVHGVESGERKDHTLEAEAALGFDATRWLTLEAGATWERRTSSFATFEYDDTRLWASARAAF
jgi:hypothetical protein